LIDKGTKSQIGTHRKNASILPLDILRQPRTALPGSWSYFLA
jgi:hypothetical protein